jgi:raffinose/stachyose/melibiose transport system substrate-binding protein
MLAASIIGCGSNTQAPAGSAAPVPSASQAPAAVTSSAPATELKVMDWDTNYEDVNKTIAAAYNKLHPNVTINFIEKDFSQYFTLLPTMIQSGEAPDLFATLAMSNSSLSNLVSLGCVLPLDGKFDSSQYPDWLLKCFSVGGKIYAIPGLSEDSNGVFYNKTVFAKYGLDVPKTQADMDNIMKTLQSKGVTPIALPAKSSFDTLLFYNGFIQAYGSDWLSNFPFKGSKFADQGFVNATNQFVDWLNKGYFGSDYEALDVNSAIMEVMQGTAAMYENMESTVPSFTDASDIGVFYFKRADGLDAGITSPRQDLALSVYSKSPNVDAAVDFAKYFAGKDAQQAMNDVGGGVPSTFDAAKGLTVSDPLLQQFTVRNHTEMNFVDLAGFIQNTNEDYLDGMSDLLQKLIFKQINVTDFVTGMDKLMDYTKANQ